MELLSEKVARLKEKYNLTDCGIDIECIYQKGDLSNVLKKSLCLLLPDRDVEISEALSANNEQYIATIYSGGQMVINIYADTYADFLPDTFSYSFEEIPDLLKTGKKFCLINPMITGQAMWYICGFLQDLKNAKFDGLPVILPGEDFLSQDVSEYL